MRVLKFIMLFIIIGCQNPNYEDYYKYSDNHLVKDSILEDYFENGRKKYRLTFGNGELIGNQLFFYQNGQIRSYIYLNKPFFKELPPEEGKSDTTYFQNYYINSNIEMCGLVVGGHQFFMEELNDSTGHRMVLDGNGYYDFEQVNLYLNTLKQKEIYELYSVYGILYTITYAFPEVIFSKGKYKNGLKDGKWEYYNADNMKESEIIYENGERIEKHYQ